MKWTPYVSARVGAALFSDSQLVYRYRGSLESGMMFGGIPAEYEYLLTDSAHPLTVKNKLYHRPQSRIYFLIDLRFSAKFPTFAVPLNAGGSQLLC